MAQNKHKLGVIVPYRNRYDHLLAFKQHIVKYLNLKKIEFELIIVEQDDAKAFNRGKLLNIGFKIAQELKCDYVVFHDVDMLPVNADYSYSDVPIHLATNFKSKSEFNRVVFDEYFGGVVIFPVETFEQINGYSNEYWGWGYEDNDLLYRCKVNRIDLDLKEIKMMGGNTAALKFNGHNSLVKCKNVVNLSEPITFFISFYPDDIVCNHAEYDDTYAVFTIPGFDLLISYNSYGKYNFEMYDSEKNVIYVNSSIKVNYKTNICVTIDPVRQIVKMYQDGIMVGLKRYENEIYDYSKEKFMYLGVGNPKNEKQPKYFYGLISSFAIFSKLLTEEEIKEVSKNQFLGLTQNFGKYNSSDSLLLYYDAKFIRNYKLIDLSGGKNDGEIVNCEMGGYVHEGTKTIIVPYRRPATFELLPHDENGYVGNGWKSITTRYNQLRYFNEVFKGFKNPKKEGLSTCDYKIHGDNRLDNETHVIVEI